MFARAVVRRRHARGEAEKPFWISFSDLMTACMTVFLIVMAVMLVSMKDQIARITQATEYGRMRQKEIEEFAGELRHNSYAYPQVKVDVIEDKVRIDLGPGVTFVSGSADLSEAGAGFLRGYIPKLLETARTDLGRKWLKDVAVEGFTDTDGSYLFNLDLSLQRSRTVVCAMYAPKRGSESTLTQEQLEQIRDLFLVGGYSFNSMQASKAKSRRVELKLEFWQEGEKERMEKQPKPDLTGKPFGHC